MPLLETLLTATRTTMKSNFSLVLFIGFSICFGADTSWAQCGSSFSYQAVNYSSCSNYAPRYSTTPRYSNFSYGSSCQNYCGYNSTGYVNNQQQSTRLPQPDFHTVNNIQPTIFGSFETATGAPVSTNYFGGYSSPIGNFSTYQQPTCNGGNCSFR